MSGFVTPTTTVQPTAVFENLVNSIISGITGIPAALIRPRWQPTPPPMPAFTINWVAFGFVRRIPDPNPYIGPVVNNGVVDDTQDQMQRHVIYETLCSFYGPDANDLSETLRDGLRVADNLTTLLAFDAGLHDVGETINTAELINNQWVERADIAVTIIRRLVRTYPSYSILSVPGQITIETGATQNWST